MYHGCKKNTDIFVTICARKLLFFTGWTKSTTCKYIVLSLLQTIWQHIAVEDLLQLFALFAVSNIPLVRFQQFCGIFLTEIRCLQCLQITGIHLKHNFVSLFAGNGLCVFWQSTLQQRASNLICSWYRKKWGCTVKNVGKSINMQRTVIG